jgi:hypothetical protein
MLAAMSLSFAPINEQFTQVTMEIGQVNITGGDIVRLTAPVEGGFISFTPPASGVSSDGAFHVSGGVITNSIPPFNGPDSLLDIGGLDSETNTFVQPSSNFHIQPAEIVTGNSYVLSPNIEPFRLGELAQRSDQQPGGSIPIESILKDMGPRNVFEPVEQTRASLIADAPVDPAPAADREFISEARLSTRSDRQSNSWDQKSAGVTRALSGEWARAMIFETAGGEAADFRNAVQSDARTSGAPRDVEPERSDGTPLSLQGAQHESQTAARSVSDSRRLGGDVMASGAPARSVNGIDQRLSLWASRHITAELGFDGPRSGPADLNGAAIGVFNGQGVLASTAEAFAQLGGADKAIVRTPSDDEAHAASIVAPSVLMLLALEWIAVRHWQRANHEAADVAGPPRPLVQARRYS